ncbi:hypothetical protein MRS44_005161 [Fusarium solani]|uniref:uncharacterized protein n=1 Tax=Fusarium solani TaxID=169388 RepID=UPI0032C4428A|nr:hypothetical protein MRS44_005161 [Fusarium solani]
MVRTKTRPRTLEERYPKDKYPNGPPQIRLGPARPVVSNNRIFNDHTGKPALMSWESSGSRIPCLPSPPGSFIWSIQMCRVTLTGATTEECHEHYLRELKARGTIWRHIRKVKRAMELENQKNPQPVEDDPAEESGSGLGSTTSVSSSDEEATANNQQLPGLVWPKHEHDCPSRMYRGWFFVYPHANIDCRGADGAEREIDIVTFDPIEQEWEEDEVRRFDPMEHPVHVTRKKAREDEEQGVMDWMYWRLCSHWEQKADEATNDALKLGWKSW